MNERIKELAEQANIHFHKGGTLDAGPNGIARFVLYSDMEKFAELIVRMCADYADMAQDAGCEYAGDYVAEAMGYGVEEGIATWRAKV